MFRLCLLSDHLPQTITVLLMLLKLLLHLGHSKLRLPILDDSLYPYNWNI